MAQLPSSFAGAAELLRTSTIRPLTVLVVEDDSSLLSLAAHVFGKKGAPCPDRCRRLWRHGSPPLRSKTKTAPHPSSSSRGRVAQYAATSGERLKQTTGAPEVANRSMPERRMEGWYLVVWSRDELVRVDFEG